MKFLLFLLPICSLCANMNSCPEISSAISFNQTNIINTIQNNFDTIKHKVQACVDVLVKSAKFEALEYYLSELGKHGIKYRESLQMSVNTLKKNFDDLHNKHRFDEVEYQTVFPAFQWAQSLNEVFIEIKFAHRHDSPGCLEMKDYKVNINSNQVSFIGYCVIGDVPIKIDFHIKTHSKINKKMSTYGFGSVGRFQITLRKSKEGTYWKKLLADGSVMPGHMRMWFEMKEKYEEELKKFEEESEEMEFRRELEEIKKKAESKRSKKKKGKKKGKGKSKKTSKGKGDL